MRTLILLALSSTLLFSCTKTEQTPDKNSPFYDTLDLRHSSIEGGVVISARGGDPIYVRMPTVVMIAKIPNNFVVDFIFTYVPNTLNGGGNVTASNFHVYGADYATGISSLIPGTIVSWQNYRNSNLIYATIKAKWNYYVLVANNEFANTIISVYFDIVYNTLTGKSTITTRTVSGTTSP